jgi:FecR-like protein
MKFFSKIILLIIFISASLLANDVATITGLNGNAFVERDGQEVELNLGDKLQEKDVVLTKDKTKVQIIFKDETIITIGKNSTFAINEYLFEENQEPVAKFGMLSGAMRAITGKIGKVAPDKFTVKTKTATMGIRGTNFSVLVGEDGSYQAYCTYGAISVTIKGSEHVVQQGFFISISPDGKVEQKEFTSEDLKEMKKKNFAKSKAKKGDGSEDDDASASNDGQLDTTTEEQDNIVVKDISDSVADAEQTADLTSLLSSYSMSDALYEGTYSFSFNSGDLPANGDVKIEIDFGKDIVKFYLDPLGLNMTIDGNSALSGTSLSVDGGGNSATGEFSEPTGNSLSGTITGDFGGGQGSASYEATSINNPLH